jgi:hypothetical protein
MECHGLSPKAAPIPMTMPKIARRIPCQTPPGANEPGHRADAGNKGVHCVRDLGRGHDHEWTWIGVKPAVASVANDADNCARSFVKLRAATFEMAIC